VAHVISLVSITVAGAAPALDESTPDFPFHPAIACGHLKTTGALARAPYVARSLCVPRVRRQAPVPEARVA